MQDLGTLGGNCAGTTNGGINDNGWIIGQSTTSATPNPITGAPPWDPFLWRKGIGMTDLGSFGGAWGEAYGLNERGQIFGVSSIASDPGACNGFPDNGDYNCHPFLWEQGKKLRDLSTTSIGGSPQAVQSINSKGEMVGVGVFKDAPYPDAFIWRHGVMTDLGHLRGCGSIAHAINSPGQVVGFVGPCNSNPRYIEAFLWENGSIVDLNKLIPRDSRLHLVTADDINDRGEIDGTGVPPGVSPQKSLSQGRGFLLIPCDNNHKNIEGCDYSPIGI
jgi:probable HAF family extracellular repeat protein